jgi:integrase
VARRTWTDRTVANLKPKRKAYAEPDPALPGHYCRVQPSGSKSYVAVARDPRGKQIWHTVGSPNVFRLDAARNAARAAMQAIKVGHDHAPPQSFEAVAADWMVRHVEKKGLRSRKEIERHVERMNRAWAGRDFETIRRSDVAKFLDVVEDKHGTRQADYALAVIRGMANWYARRHENYMSPIVRGMQRRSPKEMARDRILNDDELRAVWQVASENGTHGAVIQLLLLTAQRLEKVASMKWADVSLDGVWTIPTEAREKGNANELQLPESALEIIRAQPRFANNPFIFAGRDRDHFKSWTHGKNAIDAKLPDTMPDWRLHDLRRTARSLMSRAGVRPDIAERVLGHAIPGIGGVYDRHRYNEEKAHVLKSLAALIEKVVNPPAENVVSLSSDVREL